MTTSPDPLDPKGLIRESYRMDGISAPECRSIFLDWAISVPEGADPVQQITALLQKYGQDQADHPMTEVLKAALTEPARTGRRGGARGRRT